MKMSNVINSLPQVGRTISPESHPIKEMGCPTDFGGGEPSTSAITATFSLVVSQAEGSLNATGDNSTLIETKDPFAKRDRMARTPPRARTFSLPDIEIREETQTLKRRRGEDSRPDHLGLYNNKLEVFKETVNAMHLQIKHLESILGDTYKPKKEFCEISSKMSMLIEKLDTQEIIDLIGGKMEEAYHTKENSRQIREYKEEQSRLLTENEQLRQQLKLMDGENCEECRKARRRKQKIRELKTSETYECFKCIPEEEWNGDTFAKTTIKQCQVWEAPTDYDIILPCNRNILSTYSSVNKAIEHFGGKNGLRKQNKTVGNVAIMTHSVGFPDSEGEIAQHTRWIYYPIHSDSVNENDSGDGDLFNSLQQVKASMTAHKRTKLVVPDLGNVTGHIMVRMLEFLFVNTDVQIILCSQPNKTERVNLANRPERATRQENSQMSNQKSKTKKDRPKRDTIIVQIKDKSYADLLKTVKSAVNPSAVGVEIENMKSTRKGELLLTVQNGADKAEVLKRELIEKVPGASASILVSKKIIHIKDMDEVTTDSEIEEAISKATGANSKDFEVRAIRPAYGNKQNATVVINDQDASKLIQSGKIKIGWTQCRVLERKKDPRCYRCWEHGHIKAQCKGPNREGLCIKCAKEGHTARQCKNVAFCVTCNQEGHQTYSRKCEAIRTTDNENTTNQY